MDCERGELMDLQKLARAIDARTAQAFVTAARHVIDALLIEGERVAQMQTPGARDYNDESGAVLPRGAPAGGWISHAELRDTSKRLAEAIAAERWTEGLLAALKLFSVVGGVL